MNASTKTDQIDRSNEVAWVWVQDGGVYAGVSAGGVRRA